MDAIDANACTMQQTQEEGQQCSHNCACVTGHRQHCLSMQEVKRMSYTMHTYGEGKKVCLAPVWHVDAVKAQHSTATL
jgi:hypothetical protein